MKSIKKDFKYLLVLPVDDTLDLAIDKFFSRKKHKIKKLTKHRKNVYRTMVKKRPSIDDDDMIHDDI